jgi:hypothetical protein
MGGRLGHRAGESQHRLRLLLPRAERPRLLTAARGARTRQSPRELRGRSRTARVAERGGGCAEDVQPQRGLERLEQRGRDLARPGRGEPRAPGRRGEERGEERGAQVDLRADKDGCE